MIEPFFLDCPRPDGYFYMEEKNNIRRKEAKIPSKSTTEAFDKPAFGRLVSD